MGESVGMPVICRYVINGCLTVKLEPDGPFCDKDRKLDVLGIRELVSAPASPWQNAYVERLIGTIRREPLDNVIVLNERYLRRLLKSYAGGLHHYYLPRLRDFSEPTELP